MALYNVSQLVGKTLTAAKSIEIVRIPFDNSESVYTVKSGQAIGRVYSYVLPTEGRAYLYWMFLDTNNDAYWVRHEINAFSIAGQGILTVAEQAALDAQAKTLLEKVGQILDGGAENVAETGEAFTTAIKILTFGGVAFLGAKAFEAVTGKNIIEYFKKGKK